MFSKGGSFISGVNASTFWRGTPPSKAEETKSEAFVGQTKTGRRDAIDVLTTTHGTAAAAAASLTGRGCANS